MWVAARQHQALLTPTQMHERDRLVAEQATHERVVVGTAGDIEQVHESNVRLPARQTVETGDAAARPRIGSHLFADGPQDEIERGSSEPLRRTGRGAPSSIRARTRAPTATRARERSRRATNPSDSSRP